MPPPPPRAEARAVDAALLRSWPLAGHDRPKAERGTCLVVGGSALTPGSVLLAVVAALRSGAGKVQAATVRSATQALAVAVPEALVVGLDEDAEGDPVATVGLRPYVVGADAVLVGPGCLGQGTAGRLLAEVAALSPEPTLVVDAHALPGLRDDPSPLRGRQRLPVLTPNLPEALALAGVDDAGEPGLALDLARELGAVVAVRGADSWVAEPSGRAWCVPGGGPGLSIPGSGDVVAGLVAGLVARTGDPVQGIVHALHAHAEAGRRLAARVARLGYLARELPDEIPAILDELAPG